jgi:hypothetical protein
MRRWLPALLAAALLAATASTTEDANSNSCESELTSTSECQCDYCTLHNSTWLRNLCCAFKGVPATLLAFEKDSDWAPRLRELYRCTGARLCLTFIGPDGQGAPESDALAAYPLAFTHDPLVACIRRRGPHGRRPATRRRRELPCGRGCALPPQRGRHLRRLHHPGSLGGLGCLH